MRIDLRTAGLAGATPTAKSGPTGPAAERFRLGDGAERSMASRAARSAAPLETMDAILALQGDEGETGGERRRRAARRGQDLLAGLDGLKAALLDGRVPAADLRRLAGRLWSGDGPTGDSGLDAVVEAIELRAKVELAKLGIA